VSDAGLDDGAILLLTLGEEEASEVFKHLAPKEVQKLSEAMAKMKGVTRERVNGVLEKFSTEASEHSSVGSNSDQYLRSVLVKALGNEKASYILDRILQGGDVSGIEALKWIDAPTVAELVKNEHPQIIASILVHLERDHAASVLGLFTDRLRNDVVLRIATLEGIQPAALSELNESLAKILNGTDQLKRTALGGVRAAAEILNFMGSTAETTVIEGVREYDQDLAQQIQDEMFVFDNLLDLDDKGIQLVLREVQSESLVVALKGTSEAIRDKVFKNMSQRAAEMLRDDLDSKGPVRVSEVETEQKEILKIVRRLAEEGQIALGGGGEDQFV
jgi:flagellar motor switch protein FliG